MASSRSRFAGVATLLVMLSAVNVVAQVQVDFSPASINLNIGESALVAVDVSGLPGSGLAAFQFDLTYDTIPIDLRNPNEAFRGSIDAFIPLGNNASCTTVRGTPMCDDPDWQLITTGRTPLGTDTIDDPAGTVRIAYASHGAQALPQSDGAIALIEVYGAYNGTVTVDFAALILADDQTPPTVYTVTPNSLTVVVGTGIANQAPVLAPIGNRSTFENLVLTIPIVSSDADGNGLSLSAAGLPAFCNLADNGDGSGSLDCSPGVGDAGLYTVTVGVTDDGAPNLSDPETFDIDVQPTNCNDGDGDGFGVPGDISCPLGNQVDCDDTVAAVNPNAFELCRNTADDDCNGLADAQEPQCPAAVCIVVTLGAPASDPVIAFDDAALCLAPGALARTIDLVWGDLAAVVEVAGEIKVGAVTSVACANTDDIQRFDNLRPDSGQIDFFLVRETGQADYGTGTGALLRSPDLGDCP